MGAQMSQMQSRLGTMTASGSRSRSKARHAPPGNGVDSPKGGGSLRTVNDSTAHDHEHAHGEVESEHTDERMGDSKMVSWFRENYRIWRCTAVTAGEIGRCPNGP